jgi:CO/xanthine dehydrogenase Mo-binding subunit
MSSERINISRREFLIRSGAAGAGFALGLSLPGLGRGAIAAEGMANAEGAGAETPEINAWVVIQPDDTVVIRIARSEMGQGTLTGLAQLVAEELSATGRRSPPSTRRPARICAATASGAASPPAAAAASARAMTMCARAAPWRGRC